MTETSFKAMAKTRINVREGAGSHFPRLGALIPGEIIEVTGIEAGVSGDQWFRFEGGYVAAKFMRTGPDLEDQDARVSAFSNGPVKRQSTGSKPIAKLVEIPRDDPFNETSVNGRAEQYRTAPIQSSNNPFDSGMLGSLSGQSLESALDNSLSGSNSANLTNWYRRKVFGTPHQFLPTTDIRPNIPSSGADGSIGKNMGRIYGQYIITEMPVLSMMPCRPAFLPHMGDEQKTQYFETLVRELKEASDNKLIQEYDANMLHGAQVKYFGTDVDYVEYMKYVNFLCRAAAIYMGIGNKIVPGTPNTTYAEYNWSRWSMRNQIDGSQNVAPSALENADEMKDNIIKGALKGEIPYLSVLNLDEYYTDFYVTPSTSYSDSYSNEIGESKLKSAMQAGSDLIKEVQFVMGSGGMDSKQMQQSMANFSKDLSEKLAQYNNSGSGLFSRLFNDAQAILSGSNIIFPEIWKDAKRGQSFSAELKLISPYGAPEAIYLHCLVPLFHLLPYACPRQTSVNSYGAPFMFKAHMAKWFAVEMGMMESMQLTKGGWTKDGFPTEYTISMSFTDLYQALPVSKMDGLTSATCAFHNQALLEYLSILCGMNLKTTEYAKRLDLIMSLLKNVIPDASQNFEDRIRQEVSNTAISAMGSIGLG